MAPEEYSSNFEMDPMSGEVRVIKEFDRDDIDAIHVTVKVGYFVQFKFTMVFVHDFLKTLARHMVVGTSSHTFSGKRLSK